MERERVVIAMSGGLDSAVAAARLVDEGHEVVGVTLHLWDYADDGREEGRCCAPEDQYDARRTADRLGFPHYTFDRRELFERSVVAPFVDAYLAGETPSPCAACNRTVKLVELCAIADRLGARRVATGHYARVGRDPSGHPFVARARDLGKDQSYFLYSAPREILERLVFPLGDAEKPDVRAEAAARALPGAGKGESQELCFVAGAYGAFVEARAPRERVRPGPIVDERGREVGAHEGVHRFTIGQRKGLGVALGAPAFVTEIDAATGTVHVATRAREVLGAELEDVLLAPGITLPRAVTARLRYRHEGVPATAAPRGERGATLRFESPTRGVAPGQIAVLYDGDRVLGGGRVARALGQEGAAVVASSA